MKKITTHHEILLLTGSRFFQRDWCELNKNDSSKGLSQKERLVELCWNGMLNEMIPELCETGPDKNPLPLWNIYEFDNLLGLQYGAFNQPPDTEWSINPYMIVDNALKN